MPIFRLYADGVDYFIDEITTLESGQIKVLVNSIQKNHTNLACPLH
jgi:hypothetical protein